MPESWFFATGFVTMIASMLDQFVESQRQPQGRTPLSVYLHILRRPLQAVREWEWSIVSIVIAAAFHLGVYLILIVGLSLALLVSHSTSVLLPGCFWPIVALPLLAVLSLVWGLRKNGTPRAVQPPAEGPVTEPDR